MKNAEIISVKKFPSNFQFYVRDENGQQLAGTDVNVDGWPKKNITEINAIEVLRSRIEEYGYILID